MKLPPVPHVPRLQAVSVGDEKCSGATKPIAMQCQATGSSEIEQYVVKLHSSVRLNQRGLARELFAALLGQMLGFHIPAASVVEIDPDLYRSVVSREVAVRIQLSHGANFGSRTVVPAIIFKFLPDDQLSAAAEVFAFDMLLQNPDRRLVKPNMFQNSAQPILFDHEMAFPYADPRMLLGFKPEPWSVTRNDKLVTDHIFYSKLRKNGTDVSFHDFSEKLTSLSDEVLAEIVSRIPDEWIVSEPPEMDNICQFIRFARDNADRFEQWLMEVLA
jgi:hypothetical protein